MNDMENKLSQCDLPYRDWVLHSVLLTQEPESLAVLEVHLEGLSMVFNDDKHFLKDMWEVKTEQYNAKQLLMLLPCLKCSANTV